MAGNYSFNVTNYTPLSTLEISQVFTANLTISRTNYTSISFVITVKINNREFGYQLDLDAFTGNILEIYSGDAINFKIAFNDTETGDPIIGAEVNMTFQENNYPLTDNSDGNYTIDNINYQDLDPYQTSVTYTATISINMTGYTYKTFLITIVINKREMEYKLDENKFVGNVITIYSGDNISFTIDINDTATHNALDNTQVNMIFRSGNYSFTDHYNGTYSISTADYDTLNENEISQVYSATLTLRRENYTAVDVVITIKITNRQFEYNFTSNNLVDENLIVIYTGELIYLQLEVNDTMTKTNVSDADVQITFQGSTYNFTNHNNGTYSIELPYSPLSEYVISQLYTGEISINKTHYLTKVFQVTISIQKRIIEYLMYGDNFIAQNVISIYSGENIIFYIDINDTSNNNSPLTDANITITFQGSEIALNNLGNGTYWINLTYTPINEYLTAQVFTGDIVINKTNYKTESFQIAIQIKNLEIGYELPDDKFTDNIISIYSGENLNFGMLINNTLLDSYLIGAEVNMSLQSSVYAFTDLTNGSYIINIGKNYLPEEGTFTANITIRRTNFFSKSFLITIVISKRSFTSSLDATNLIGSQTNVVKGTAITIILHLNDSTQGNAPLTNATVFLRIQGIDFEFEEISPGVYMYVFGTSHINTFLTSQTLTGDIVIQKENYETQILDFTVVVGMEEILPGIPTFYFLMIVGAIIAVVGSLVTYRRIQKARIPEFIKKVDEIEHNIKKDKSIPKSLSYPSKEDYIVKKLKNKWDLLGLSLKDIMKKESKETFDLEKDEETDISKDDSKRKFPGAEEEVMDVKEDVQEDLQEEIQEDTQDDVQGEISEAEEDLQGTIGEAQEDIAEEIIGVDEDLLGTGEEIQDHISEEAGKEILGAEEGIIDVQEGIQEETLEDAKEDVQENLREEIPEDTYDADEGLQKMNGGALEVVPDDITGAEDFLEVGSEEIQKDLSEEVPAYLPNVAYAPDSPFAPEPTYKSEYESKYAPEPETEPVSEVKDDNNDIDNEIKKQHKEKEDLKGDND
jgi:hypothetical protein